MSVYYSMIFSHLNYCVINWEKASETTLKPLLLLQKRAECLITNSDFHAHANPLFKDLNILTIYDIFKLEVAKYSMCIK